MLETILAALVIFALRIVDVSFGTLRIVMLVRGKRYLAGVLGFTESLIWLYAFTQVVTNLDSPVKMVAFAGGFAAGTMMGSTIERWLALGSSMMRIVTAVDSPPVAPHLRDKGYQVTVVNAEGRSGDVRIAFSVIPRRRVNEVMKLVQEVNPQAFVSFEEVSTNRGAHQMVIKTPTTAAHPAARVRK